jgi:hypothetical protein
MEFYGTSGKANKLIQSYLKDKYQTVLFKNNLTKHFSEWEPIKHESPSRLNTLTIIFPAVR